MKHRAAECFVGMVILAGTAHVASAVDYTYDSLQRLIRVDYGGGRSIAYSYDAAGNRLTMISQDDQSGDPFTYTTQNDAIIITQYTGFGGAVTIPGTMNGLPVTSIGANAFYARGALTSVTIPASVTHVGDNAFSYCTGLTGIYFKGNAPSIGSSAFYGDNDATAYYLAGTPGWGTTLGDRPVGLWEPQAQLSDPSFGVRTNQFGFTLAWASGMGIVVEACTNLANPSWFPLQTNILKDDSFYFSDPKWTNYPARHYRIRSP
jgi:YD repeat-containing protein